MHKIAQSGGFLGRILRPLLKTGLLLMKNVLNSLAKSLLILLGLTASASDAAIIKNVGIWHYNIINLKWRNEWSDENN